MKMRGYMRIVGQQSSHCLALVNGRAVLNLTLARIMGLETFEQYF
jgi:hypothetical protein